MVWNFDTLSIDSHLLFENFTQIVVILSLSYALFFFGKTDKADKNHLFFTSLAFLLFSLQKICNVFAGLFVKTTQDFSLNWVVFNLIMTIAVSLLFVIGAFQYARVLVWIKKKIIFSAYMLVCDVAFVVLTSDEYLFQTLPLTYFASGLLFLGGVFIFTRFRKSVYNLRLTGFFFLILSLFYFQVQYNLFPWIDAFFIKNTHKIETLLYFVITLVVFYTTLVQTKKAMLLLLKNLKDTKAHIPMIIRASPFPIVISTLKDDRLLLVNNKASTLFNIDTHNLSLFKAGQYFVDANKRQELLQLLSENGSVENFEALLKQAGTNETFWLEISANIIEYNNEVALFCAFKDVTGHKKMEQDLFAKAVLDPLTGCYNRRQFQELATKEIHASWRYDTPFCILMMDIDHFKSVNDTYGHSFGDEVLKALARLCKASLRESDIFARYGGEEFIALLSHTQLVDGMKVAERLRKSIEEYAIPLQNGEEFHFSVSLGLAENRGSDNLENLIKNADHALYKAKENGRNQVQAYCDLKIQGIEIK